MLIESQNNKVDLKSNSAQTFETVKQKSNRKVSIHKTDESKCSNRYETLYTDDNDDESGNSYGSNTSSEISTLSDENFDKISSGTRQKKKNQKNSMKKKETKGKDQNTVIKKKEENSKCEIKTIKKKKGNLDIHKNRYYHQSKAPVERIQSTFGGAVTRKRKKVGLFSDIILKNLQVGEFSNFIKKREASLKAFPGAKTRQLNHHTISAFDDLQQLYMSV